MFLKKYVDKYLQILNKLNVQDPDLYESKQALLQYEFSVSLEEAFAWVSCVLALKAASGGNIGVGAILVEDAAILYEACNEMFHPYFRSDAHPEMIVLSDYEKDNSPDRGDMSNITMYSSLEPCPMCLTRISTTNIGMVSYISAHPGSGMATCVENLPKLWQIFCEDLSIKESTCSSELKKISHTILDVSVKVLGPKILARKQEEFPNRKVDAFLNNL